MVKQPSPSTKPMTHQGLSLIFELAEKKILSEKKRLINGLTLIFCIIGIGLDNTNCDIIWLDFNPLIYIYELLKQVYFLGACVRRPP